MSPEGRRNLTRRTLKVCNPVVKTWELKRLIEEPVSSAANPKLVLKVVLWSAAKVHDRCVARKLKTLVR